MVPDVVSRIGDQRDFFLCGLSPSCYFQGIPIDSRSARRRKAFVS